MNFLVYLIWSLLFHAISGTGIYTAKLFFFDKQNTLINVLKKILG